MKKVLVLGWVLLLLVSITGCGGGVSGGDSDFTHYTGDPVIVSGTITPTPYGQLQVLNGQLCDHEGNAVQLRGMSTMGLQWFGYTAATVDKLVNDWHITVLRVAMYVNEGGYLQDASVKNKVDTLVLEAIRKGIYVIIDWHTLNNNGGYDTTNPNNVKTQAQGFFDEMATKYGAYPNVLYEICNEPNGTGTTWTGQIKPYAEDVIPVIRARDTDNIVIVGTPTWSQGVDSAAASPLDPAVYTNIMYTMHFYAGSHTQWLRDRANAALANGIAIFVTEWGTTDASGNGTLYTDEAQLWIDWMSSHHISWCNWSLCDKTEASAALIPGSGVSVADWNDATDLSVSGAWVKARIYP